MCGPGSVAAPEPAEGGPADEPAEAGGPGDERRARGRGERRRDRRAGERPLDGQRDERPGADQPQREPAGVPGVILHGPKSWPLARASLPPIGFARALVCDNPCMSNDLPPELLESLKVLDPDLQERIKQALLPVAAEIGPRELAVLDRLAQGISKGASVAELNAFVRLLPVSVSRVVQPTIDEAVTA